MSFAACAPVSTGSGFLRGSLAWLDCAGQAIGSVGYAALAQPGSAISQLMFVAITLFIAWHGVRMMFGWMPDMGSAVLAVAKIGLVLMLVTSWPAVRTLFAEPSFSGPSELAAETKLEGPIALEDRLQRADDGIVALTKWGTGKLDIRVGQTADGQPAATEFSGIALADNLALGLGRLAFLLGTLMSIGLLKLLAGIMLSALPIFAGLLLFEASRSLFWGWLRLVFALFVASFAMPLLLTAELGLIEPWLTRAIEQRASLLATPSAPTELLAMTGSFMMILAGSLFLIVRACFSVDMARAAARIGSRQLASAAEGPATQPSWQPPVAERTAGLSRAESLVMTLGRIDQMPRSLPAIGGGHSNRVADNDSPIVRNERGRAGGSARRARQRTALSHSKRNQS